MQREMSLFKLIAQIILPNPKWNGYGVVLHNLTPYTCSLDRVDRPRAALQRAFKADDAFRSLY